jgi:hypothetical protein
MKNSLLSEAAWDQKAFVTYIQKNPIGPFWTFCMEDYKSPRESSSLLLILASYTKN